MPTAISTPNPLTVDDLTREGGSERRAAYLAIATAHARYAEVDLEIGKQLYAIYQRELYRDSVAGPESWAAFLSEEYPYLTGGVALTKSEAKVLMEFYYFREIAPTQCPDLGDYQLPPTKEHVEPLTATGDVDLAVRAWRIACDSTPDGIPSIQRVQLATQLVLSE